jgi:hypothetical protein
MQRRINIIIITIIKLIFRKRTLGPNLEKNDGFLNYSIQDQNVDKRSTNKSKEEETEEYDVGQIEILLKSGTLEPPEQYDYEKFKSDYYNEVQEAQHSNTSFNYTIKGKYEETIGDAINEIVDFHKPKNCSMEEERNFGIKSIECLWDDLKKSHTKQDKIQFLKRLIKVLIIWLLIYIAIAVPCWCKFGKHNILHFYLQSS